jgi:hypothetical protein
MPVVDPVSLFSQEVVMKYAFPLFLTNIGKDMTQDEDLVFLDVTVKLTEQQAVLLGELADSRLFGNSLEDVAKHMVQCQLEQFVKAGVLTLKDVGKRNDE